MSPYEEVGINREWIEVLGHPDGRSHIQSLRNIRSCENICDRVSFLNTSILYVRTYM